MASRCKRCLGVLPETTGGGLAELRTCAACRAADGTGTIAPPLPPRRRHLPGLLVVGGIAAVLTVIMTQAGSSEPSAAPAPTPPMMTARGTPAQPAQAQPDVDAFAGDIGSETEVVADDEPTAPYPDETRLAAMFPVPEVNGTWLDDLYPTLDRWVHPVTDSTQLVPLSPTRKFGAARPSLPTIRPECGLGHCGLDLDGPRGQPLVAVAAGRIIRIERSWAGHDGRSGRYVRMEHLDGTITAYMHMDTIAPGLDVGDDVEAGQFIGTLGATAVAQSAPHCHFSLELPRSGRRANGDTTDTYYIDPSPFLVRSQVISQPDYREATPPPTW